MTATETILAITFAIAFIGSLIIYHQLDKDLP